MCINSKILCCALTATATLSLAFNVVQCRETHNTDSFSSLTAFFAYADDQGVHALVSRRANIQSAVAQNTDAASLYASLRNETAFRDYPTAGFLVIQNQGQQNITGVRVRVPSSANPIGIAFVAPAEFVFVPLDFIKPDERARSLNVPPEVVISYAGGSDLRVSPVSTPVHWLDDHFLRGMPPR